MCTQNQSSAPERRVHLFGCPDPDFTSLLAEKSTGDVAVREAEKVSGEDGNQESHE